MSFRWSDRTVREALGQKGSDEESQLHFAAISTDTRSLNQGDLFLALEGERFDGHDFLFQAAARGAAGAIVARDVTPEPPLRLYVVPDTLQALGRLAAFRRQALSARVVGITGSTGKTGTKDLLMGALEGTLRVHATPGNLNNRVGLPLTLLAAPADAQVVILEMGTNEPGEVQTLTEIGAPEIGVLTTVGESHLEKLGSLAGVLDEKLDLLRGLPSTGLAVVGDEPPILAQRARELHPNLAVTGWSRRAPPENRPQDPSVSSEGCYDFRWRGEKVQLRVPGRHSVQNALLALAVSDALGVPHPDAAAGVSRIRPRGLRSEIRSLGDLTLLVDCYNANPQSLRAALDLLLSVRSSGARLAVLGSMLELGQETRALHRQSLEEALSLPIDLVVATGLFAEVAEEVDPGASGADLHVAPGLDEARAFLLEVLEGREVVLLKASRGVAMEALIPSLEERFGEGRAA